MATYWGGAKTRFGWSSYFDKKELASSKLEMSSHTGTHIDAPLHFIKGGDAIDAVPLASLVGYGRILDFRSAPIENGVIAPSYFEARASVVKSGEIVVVHTGIWEAFGKERFTTEMLVPSEESTSYLLYKEIKAYATDCISVDPLGGPAYPNHHRLLGAGIPIIEGLTNLDKVHENPVFIIALPLKLIDREAAPSRVIALEGLSL
jgi:kynurenine formamidase